MKLSTKQKEVIQKMREGWIFIIGQSDFTGNTYYQVARNKGEVIQFNATVFKNLLYKDLIWQETSYPFRYILTPLGKSITI